METRRSRWWKGLGVGMLALCVAAVAAAPAGASPSEAAGRRVAWLFNNGSFRKMQGGWFKQVPGRQVALREIARTAHYVTISYPSGKTRFRLYERTAYRWSAETGKWAYWQPGRWEDPRKRPLNLNRLPGERGRLTNPTERRAFPHLGRQFEVLGPATRTYNCIAWTIGATNQWVWRKTLRDFDDLYSRHGYRRMSGLNYHLIPGCQKIVLYGKRTGNGGWILTHGARQMADGSWSSKLGSLPLIRHLDPDDLDGASYGVPVAVYVRSNRA
jgi:hypothetical protein